jgi:hypothetical protein
MEGWSSVQRELDGLDMVATRPPRGLGGDSGRVAVCSDLTPPLLLLDFLYHFGNISSGFDELCWTPSEKFGPFRF